MIEVVNEAVKSANNYHSDFARSKLVEALGGDSGNYNSWWRHSKWRANAGQRQSRTCGPRAFRHTRWTRWIQLPWKIRQQSTEKYKVNLLAQRFPSIREIIAPSKSLSSKAGLYVRHREPQRGAAIHFKFSLFWTMRIAEIKFRADCATLQRLPEKVPWLRLFFRQSCYCSSKTRKSESNSQLRNQLQRISCAVVIASFSISRAKIRHFFQKWRI